MTKQRLLFFIGIWVAVLPFLGFPSSIRKIFFLMTGLGIILLSYFMYIQIKAITEMDEQGGGIFVKEDPTKKSEANESEQDIVQEELTFSEEENKDQI